MDPLGVGQFYSGANIARAAGIMYGLNQSRVTEVIRKVRNAITTWQHEADGLGISRREQDMMSGAFVSNEA